MSSRSADSPPVITRMVKPAPAVTLPGEPPVTMPPTTSSPAPTAGVEPELGVALLPLAATAWSRAALVATPLYSPAAASRKVAVDAPARVRVPLMLSDTWTCPVESYWATQPTSRSPACTTPPSGIVALVTRPGVESAPDCTAVIAPAGGVVAGTGDDWAEWLPAPSKASTV